MRKILVLIGFFVVCWWFLPWRAVVFPSQITVVGTSKSDVSNNIASFSATVSVYNNNKDTAVSEVNQKMSDLVSALKSFGISEKDIKTQSISVNEYQGVEAMIYPPVPNKVPGKWQATNTVEITLRDVSKASALTDLLQQSGATNVYGPNFVVDNSEEAAASLLKSAMEDAKSKADAIAKGEGLRVGRVLSVVEGSVNYPYPVAMDATRSSGSAPVEPGSQSLSKTVTVVYSLSWVPRVLGR